MMAAMMQVCWLMWFSLHIAEVGLGGSSNLAWTFYFFGAAILGYTVRQPHAHHESRSTPRLAAPTP